MSSVLELGISELGGKEIKSVKSIKVVENKGIVGDRHFHDYNDPYNQITLIESENIDEYNLENKLEIPYLYFRRNIVTKEIKLNKLVVSKFSINEILLEGIDLCRPCKHLQTILGHRDIIKKFLQKGGLRCQILKSGEINLKDVIKIQ